MCRAECFATVCWDYVQGLAQRHTELMHDLEQRMDSERAALRQEAAAMAASAAAAGEEHGRAATQSRQAAADLGMAWRPAMGLFRPRWSCSIKEHEVQAVLPAWLAVTRGARRLLQRRLRGQASQHAWREQASLCWCCWLTKQRQISSQEGFVQQIEDHLIWYDFSAIQASSKQVHVPVQSSISMARSTNSNVCAG